MLAQRASYEEAHGKMDVARRYAKKAYEINPNALTLQLLRRISAPSP
jgi:hypothetical protein